MGHLMMQRVPPTISLNSTMTAEQWISKDVKQKYQWPNVKHCPHIFLGELRNTFKNLSQDTVPTQKQTVHLQNRSQKVFFILAQR
jgi:hypothetical protein